MLPNESPTDFGLYSDHLIGLSALTKMAFRGGDLGPTLLALVDRINRDPEDAGAILDLSTIAQLQGNQRDALILQSRALELATIFHQAPTSIAGGPLRLLVFAAPGDFMTNMPIEFMLESANVALTTVYVRDQCPSPSMLPDHDIAYVAVSQSRKNERILRSLEQAAQSWPRPIVNSPARIARLSRDGVHGLLNSVPGIEIPMTARIGRAALERLACNKAPPASILAGADFPIIARPLDSHSGNGLAKLESREHIREFLQQRSETEFYIAPFVDYRGEDGLYRKYRIALIEGQPHACHMAISPRWMIHYFNADMIESADHRAEEARFMQNFDRDFGARHARTLRAIAERVNLDYVPFDCGETRDGRLLLFEIGTSMIIHAMDPPDLFPYKRPQMEKIFAAFDAMLRNASRRHPGVAVGD
jgi:hypothetical protein